MQTILGDLKLIMFGTLILLIDFHISSNNNSVGFRIDLINDFIGALMVFFAIARMAKIEMMNKSYAKNMRFVKMAAILLMLLSIHDFFIYDEPSFVILFKKFASIIISIGVILFFISMIILAKEKSLKNSIRRMKRALNLILLVCILPALILEAFYWADYMPLLYEIELWLRDRGLIILLSIIMIAIFSTIFHGLLMIQKMREELRRLYKL